MGHFSIAVLAEVGDDKDRTGYAVQLVRATEDILVGERNGDELCVPAGDWMLR